MWFIKIYKFSQIFIHTKNHQSSILLSTDPPLRWKWPEGPGRSHWYLRGSLLSPTCIRQYNGFRCVDRALQWRHNGHDGVSNPQPHDRLLNCLFKRRSKKTSKLRVTGLCEGNSPVTGEFPAQKASNAENVSIWCHHGSRGSQHQIP